VQLLALLIRDLADHFLKKRVRTNALNSAIKMISIILVEPRNSGNIGAIARVMANFGYNKLVLVNPKCNHLSQTARNRAKHAQKVLKQAKVLKKLPKKHTLIATTARIGRDYNIPRSPITPSMLSEIIKDVNTGLVFGREGHGLSNEEILACDFVVTIPTDTKYPSMNLSHAIALVLYELSKKKTGKVAEHIVFASGTEKKQLMKMVDKRIKQGNFVTASKRDTQRKVWKRMISKSFLTKREAYALMGFFKRTK